MSDTDNARPSGEVEQPQAECENCDEPVNIDEDDYFKSPAEQFYHEDCFAEYCYGKRKLVATTEGSFKILPVVIKEIENGSETILESFWRAECPVCYRTHETDEQSEDVRTGLIDDVVGCCGIEWLAPADWIEDCEICGTSHRESRGCKPLSYRDPFPSPEEHRYECTECDWTGEGGDFGNPEGHCPECDTAAVRAIKLATDGGVETVLIQDDYVRGHAVPREEANSYVHVGIDTAYHPTGGYWFPSRSEVDGSSGQVPSESRIPLGDIIQYPCDEKQVRRVGDQELPNDVKNRVLEKEANCNA